MKAEGDSDASRGVPGSLSHHSSGGGVPLSPPHHPEGAGAQLLRQQQLAVLDQAGQGPAQHALLTLGGAAPAGLLLLRRLPASTAQHLHRNLSGYRSVT